MTVYVSLVKYMLVAYDLQYTSTISIPILGLEEIYPPGLLYQFSGFYA